jgi:hypothetical protein
VNVGIHRYSLQNINWLVSVMKVQCVFWKEVHEIADLGRRAVYGVDLRPLHYWDCGFESCRETWLSLCCVLRAVQVETSETG